MTASVGRIELEIDEAVLAVARAYAAAHGTTVEALMAGALRTMGADVMAARLPLGSSRPFITMFAHKGRDTTAHFLANGAWDDFEQPMPSFFYSWARSHPGVIVDGGANTGFYALLSAAASDRNHVLAFEPDPTIRGLLQANIDANEMAGRIVAIAPALSAQNGRAALYIPPQDHGVIETSSSLDSRFKSRFSEILEVETVTVDHAVQSMAPTGQPVSIIKIDVAGHEVAVLSGATQTVAEHRPVIFAEVLDRSDCGALSAFIARHGYL
ncbi:MAG: FkbM family methyltransferase, partial [Gemmatimonadaceae bacterium]|nr:FkbM family methyltransferase [Acetobacteraceae bacterium]